MTTHKEPIRVETGFEGDEKFWWAEVNVDADGDVVVSIPARALNELIFTPEGAMNLAAALVRAVHDCD